MTLTNTPCTRANVTVLARPAIPLSAIHTICHHDGWCYVGLTEIDRSHGEYLSEAWHIPGGDPTELVGGWLYFHDSSNRRSTFAARILGVEPLVSDSGRSLVVFRVQRVSAPSMGWRGVKASRQVRNGGIVVASRPHELNSNVA